MKKRFNHAIVWLRRDLRLDDHTALREALDASEAVTLIFIFDPNILQSLSPDDRRLSFIWESLEDINRSLRRHHAACIHLFQGNPVDIFRDLAGAGEIDAVFFNRDYEPAAKHRDDQVTAILTACNTACFSFKDQVIMEGNEVSKDDGSPYRVFTAYKSRWLQSVEQSVLHPSPIPASAFERIKPLKSFRSGITTLDQVGFRQMQNIMRGGESSALQAWSAFARSGLQQYGDLRDVPAEMGTSGLSPYLRFGNLSVRRLVQRLMHQQNQGTRVFLSELIWREFFMMILDRFPRVEDSNFNADYDRVKWLNNKSWFEAWCNGQTGVPIVDAGMRELNQTGIMHNRVRMITASFLVKHLHVDWRWGERYFASKLLDFELSSNNGNWQWAAGTGVDAAPYFRIFNPTTQGKKFDPDARYVKQWVPELRDQSAKSIYGLPGRISLKDYPAPVVDLDRERKVCLELYRRPA